jgi:hypothetical protein
MTAQPDNNPHTDAPIVLFDRSGGLGGYARNRTQCNGCVNVNLTAEKRPEYDDSAGNFHPDTVGCIDFSTSCIRGTEEVPR